MDIGSRQRVIVVEPLAAELEPAIADGEEVDRAPARCEPRPDQRVTTDADTDAGATSGR